MDRDYIVKSNKAVEQLISHGYEPQGVLKDMRSVAVLKDGKLFYFKNYLEAKEKLLNDLEIKN
jgi:hypothetical protein